MISMMFVREPVGESDQPVGRFQPELAGGVDGDQLVLYVYSEENCGLREAFAGKTIPFKGQQTYDELRGFYLKKVGSVFARVTLRYAPNLSLEQTRDGWCVLKLGGAEYPHFDGLVDRLKAAKFDATRIRGRSGCDAVAIQIPEGQELEAFKRLEPIITNVTT